MSSKLNVDIFDTDVEGIFIEINLPKTKPILIGSIYRPPDCRVEFMDKLDTLFQRCNNVYEIYFR